MTHQKSSSIGEGKNSHSLVHCSTISNYFEMFVKNQSNIIVTIWISMNMGRFVLKFIDYLLIWQSEQVQPI